MSQVPIKEGLPFSRLIMVLSSMAPLFILWAVRGSPSVPDYYFVPICLLLASGPTFVLYLRFRLAKRNHDSQTKTVGKVDDHRDRILVYLFAMLLPFYTVNLKDGREFAATIVALLFIIFLFWHLNMHYLNLLFALRGYRVFTVTPKRDNQYTGIASFVLLSKRVAIIEGEQLEAYRLSDSVFIQK
jgi:hypothetical protein